MWCRNITTLIILGATLLAIGCATTHTPRLAASQAIKLATAEAVRQLGDMHRYMPPTVSYHKEDAKWVVHWEERPDKDGMVHIGGDYWGFVDDATGHVTAQGGL